ncbi:MAG: hypothetical protein Q8Q14_00525 [Gemmatimonadales bacterium]|nr:hypothetical protein [Gemmatimonadales bacterium]
MGVRAALAVLQDQVAQVVPRTSPEQTFVFLDDGTGAIAPLEQVRDAAVVQSRVCDLAWLAGPHDDGEAQPQTASRRLRARVAIRVLYHVGVHGSRLEAQTIAAEDAESIVRRVTDPDNWDRPASGIEHVGFEGEHVAGVWTADGAMLMNPIPMTLLYREAS